MVPLFPGPSHQEEHIAEVGTPKKTSQSLKLDINNFQISYEFPLYQLGWSLKKPFEHIDIIGS